MDTILLLIFFCFEILQVIIVFGFFSVGKTTLADTLVASNGIISQKMAGKVKFVLLLIVRVYIVNLLVFYHQFSKVIVYSVASL